LNQENEHGAGGTAKAVVVVHGGAGGPVAHEDGCQAAARAGSAMLARDGDALAAAVAAVVAMEDDERFNAGYGSVLCLDGVTVEMDAAVMDSEGRLGAVACLRRVKNPVLVAQAVAGTPHWLLAGEGAERFARRIGFADVSMVSQRARRQHADRIAQLAGGEAALPGIENDAFRRFWNYAAPMPATVGMDGGDTVGAVVRDAQGRFAVAASTGGTAPALLGRVGDTPIIGSGFYAGSHGAVAATGLGEHIVRQLLAHTVYAWIEQGMPLARALERGIGLFADDIDVGLIAVSRTQAGARCNRSMATAIAEVPESGP
jgi:beta-aspartyl-peptidase (threonine type)